VSVKQLVIGIINDKRYLRVYCLMQVIGPIR